MFNSFFIIIGDLYFSIYYRIKNFSLKRGNSSSDDFDLSSRFDFNESKGSNDKKISFNHLRQLFLKYFLSKQAIAIVFPVFLILFIFSLELSLMFIVLMGMLYIFMIYYPKIRQKRMYADLNFELPYALRHMGIELKSGKGLHDTLVTVANADYGSFQRN